MGFHKAWEKAKPVKADKLKKKTDTKTEKTSSKSSGAFSMKEDK